MHTAYMHIQRPSSRNAHSSPSPARYDEVCRAHAASFRQLRLDSHPPRRASSPSPTPSQTRQRAPVHQSASTRAVSAPYAQNISSACSRRRTGRQHQIARRRPPSSFLAPIFRTHTPLNKPNRTPPRPSPYAHFEIPTFSTISLHLGTHPHKIARRRPPSSFLAPIFRTHTPLNKPNRTPLRPSPHTSAQNRLPPPALPSSRPALSPTHSRAHPQPNAPTPKRVRAPPNPAIPAVSTHPYSQNHAPGPPSPPPALPVGHSTPPPVPRRVPAAHRRKRASARRTAHTHTCPPWGRSGARRGGVGTRNCVGWLLGVQGDEDKTVQEPRRRTYPTQAASPRTRRPASCTPGTRSRPRHLAERAPAVEHDLAAVDSAGAADNKVWLVPPRNGWSGRRRVPGAVGLAPPCARVRRACARPPHSRRSRVAWSPIRRCREGWLSPWVNEYSDLDRARGGVYRHMQQDGRACCAAAVSSSTGRTHGEVSGALARAARTDDLDDVRGNLRTVCATARTPTWKRPPNHRRHVCELARHPAPERVEPAASRLRINAAARGMYDAAAQGRGTRPSTVAIRDEGGANSSLEAEHARTLASPTRDTRGRRTRAGEGTFSCLPRARVRAATASCLNHVHTRCSPVFALVPSALAVAPTIRAPSSTFRSPLASPPSRRRAKSFVGYDRLVLSSFAPLHSPSHVVHRGFDVLPARQTSSWRVRDSDPGSESYTLSEATRKRKCLSESHRVHALDRGGTGAWAKLSNVDHPVPPVSACANDEGNVQRLHGEHRRSVEYFGHGAGYCVAAVWKQSARLLLTFDSSSGACWCHSSRNFDDRDKLNEVRSASKMGIVWIADVPLVSGSPRRAEGAARCGHGAGKHEGWNREGRLPSRFAPWSVR
ncbi:hypothetical protein VTO73DRAFT_8301 [Trametes versicolor]